jgi:O-antigen/teichoic acid export membrane protein
MRQVMRDSLSYLNVERIVKWGKLISITGSAQVIIQAVGFVSGILIIRLLPTQEYAFYVLANTMLGTMTILADGGITTGVMAEGAKVWNDRQKLGQVMSTGLALRKKFAIGSLIVATPVLIYFLRHHDASWLMTTLICISLIPAFLAALSDSILEVSPKLKQDIVPLQRNQIMASINRLIMLGVTLFIFPWTFVAIFDAGITRAYSNIKLRKISNNYSDNDQKPNKEVEKNILVIVKRILPTSIYYCLSGQITIWLISIYGSTKSLAQIGALGGLSTALSLFNVIFNILIVPRFARLPNNLRTIVKNFLLIQVGLIVVAILIVAGVSFFSKYILWILGHNFVHLKTELVLVTTGSAIALVSGSTNLMLAARGIIVRPVIYIPSIIFIQVGLAFILPISQVVGVLEYGILTTVFVYLIRITNFLITLRSFKDKTFTVTA